MSFRQLSTARRALLPSPVVAAVVVGTAAAFVVQSPIAIPLSRAAERLWPLACLAALPAGVWLHAVGGRWLEVAAGQGRRVRLGVLGAVVLLAASAIGVGGAAASMAGDGPLHVAEIGRNFAAVLGLTLVVHRTPMAEVAWAPALGGVLACWLIGSSPPGLPPASWAVTLLPIDQPVAATICGGVAVLGSVIYVSGSA